MSFHPELYAFRYIKTRLITMSISFSYMKSKIFYKKKVITRVNSPGVHVITDVKNLSKSVQDSIPGGDRFFWPKIYPPPGMSPSLKIRHLTSCKVLSAPKYLCVPY